MPNRVLVVDDDATTCELIQEVLRTVDIDSLALTRSSQAFNYLSREKFDAVFLDFNMPAPHGIELTEKIRSGGLNASTPIMLITGEDDRALLGRAFEAGANFFLYKPIDRQAILKLVRAAKGPIEREKRRSRRIKVTCKVSIESGGAQLEGTTLDMSVGGMFVQVSGTLPLDAVAQCTLHLPSGSVSVAARVVRVAGEDSLGMQFENITTAVSKSLQEFLLPLIVGKSQ
jgi:DNA-binding response OmpR family regulator